MFQLLLFYGHYMALSLIHGVKTRLRLGLVGSVELGLSFVNNISQFGFYFSANLVLTPQKRLHHYTGQPEGSC